MKSRWGRAPDMRNSAGAVPPASRPRSATHLTWPARPVAAAREVWPAPAAEAADGDGRSSLACAARPRSRRFDVNGRVGEHDADASEWREAAESRGRGA